MIVFVTNRRNRQFSIDYILTQVWPAVKVEQLIITAFRDEIQAAVTVWY